VRAQKLQPTKKIVVGHSQLLVRDALRRTLAAEPTLSIVAEAGDSGRLLDALNRVRPDLLVLESTLPVGRGLSVREVMVARLRSVDTVVIGDGDLEGVLFALRAGARGWVTSAGSLADLLTCITAVLDGQLCLPAELSRQVVPRLLHPSPSEEQARACVRRLTPQERRVLQLLVACHGSKTIADELDISPQTVRTHINRILRKLKVHSRTAAVALVLNAGLEELLHDHALAE
jgi:DNA-binding NarL/FixJ family response regulator